MQRVSSNFTLFLKIFIPVFYTAFYGLFSIALIVTERSNYGVISGKWFPYSNLIFFAATLVIIYLTIWQLKRVEFDEDCFYVTDYFKTYRYNYQSLASIEDRSFIIFRIATMTFHEKTKFGRRVFFIMEPKLFKDFYEKHPDIFAGLWH